MEVKHDLKDKAILFGWIAGLLTIISVIWIFFAPVQSRYLLRTVNNVFINNNDSRRVAAIIPNRKGKADIMGYWYAMNNSTDKMFVFTVFQDGILIPLGAIISENNIVTEVIPLSAHAEQVYDNLIQNILNIYIARIEEAAKLLEGIK